MEHTDSDDGNAQPRDLIEVDDEMHADALELFCDTCGWCYGLHADDCNGA